MGLPPPKPTDQLIPPVSTGKPTLLEEVTAARDKSTDDHYAAIGKVAASWAYFEAVIDDSSIRLAKIAPQVGICLTSQIAGSARKLDAYISLARLRGASKSTIGNLCEFAKDAAGLSEQRNRAVHDPWFLDDPDIPQRLEASARKKLRLEMIIVPTSNLLNLAQKIGQLRSRFDELAVKVLAELPPSPGK